MVLDFIAENWLWLLLGVVAIGVIMSLVKTVLKWIMTLTVLAVMVMFGLNYAPDSVKDVVEQVTSYSKKEAINLLVSETSGTSYKVDKDGNYTLTTRVASLEGNVGSNSAELIIGSQEITVELNDVLRNFIKKVQNS